MGSGIILGNGTVINPEKFRYPSYTISPFCTNSLRENGLILETKKQNDSFLRERFQRFELTLSGRHAISIALSHYNLQKDDEVMIVTTSGNKYVSSCVTSEIDKYCNWSRTQSKTTRLIFVIHEFGHLYTNINELIRFDLPIIEDFSMSMFSTPQNYDYPLSDFSIYSLPKFFPVQWGGILKYNKNTFSTQNSHISFDQQSILTKLSNHYLESAQSIISIRRTTFQWYQKEFAKIGISPRFKLQENEVPSAFVFTISKNEGYLSQLKAFLQNNGIECSVFYGEDAFFLPINQNLQQFDVRYMVELVKYYLHESQ